MASYIRSNPDHLWFDIQEGTDNPGVMKTIKCRIFNVQVRWKFQTMGYEFGSS